jgi:hypothetical protein
VVTITVTPAILGDSGARRDCRNLLILKFPGRETVHVCCLEVEVQKDRSGVQYERSWDRCLPSLVAFRNQEKAEQFIEEHGGVLRLYSELTLENAEEH